MGLSLLDGEYELLLLLLPLNTLRMLVPRVVPLLLLYEFVLLYWFERYMPLPLYTRFVLA